MKIYAICEFVPFEGTNYYKYFLKKENAESCKDKMNEKRSPAFLVEIEEIEIEDAP